MTFGFREPYQVLGMNLLQPIVTRTYSCLQLLLVDAEIVRDSCQFKMDLAPALQRTVHGQVKPSKGKDNLSNNFLSH